MLDLQKIDAAINLMAAEKKIEKEKIVSIIEAAIKTAYKKDYGHRDENVNVVLNFKEGRMEISVEKTVVKQVENPALEISFEELWDDADSFKEWDIIELDVTDEVMKEDWWEAFGRIASQAARQVIIQKIWDSEKEKIFDLFKDKQGQVINMKVELVEWGKIIFDYNWNNVVLPKSEQVSRDNYTPGARFYLYVAELVTWENTVPKVVLSRKRPEIVPAIFAEMVPEIGEGIISIDRVVRQPWVKTKMLVSSNYDEIDPVGTLIGQKWIRVKWVMDELSWEKIDIVPNYWDIREIIKKALSPAKVIKVEVDEEDESSKVYIEAEERPKAVWKWWLNVNLASKLTWYKISIVEIESEDQSESQEEE
jgi:N utilization substance protein A